jgi:signal transduction histidine kinase
MTTTRLALAGLRRSEEDRVVAGVCSGIAQALAVDVTLVRLVFAVLALAGGSGILLYLGAWVLLPQRGEERPGTWAAVAGSILLVLGAGAAVGGLGLDDSLVWPAALIAAGAALLTRRRARGPSGTPVGLEGPIGIVLVVAGAVLLLGSSDPFSGAVLPAGAVLTALLLVVGPWVWRLVRERAAERSERIRTQERAELAARVHDSVLQTLALIQRDSGDARRVATLARRQERELRTWLYRDPAQMDGESLVGAIEAAATEIEELHGVRVEVASSGDCPLDEHLAALVLAAREAMANAAKFSGADEVSVYAEVDGSGATVFVRDRGAGFDRAAVPPDRRGLVESIEGRLARHGGTASITSTVGAGTEVELTMPGARE